MIKRFFKYTEPLVLESGDCFPEAEICYHTSELINEKQKPVVWICHALTASSNPEEWWPGLVGKGKLFDPERFYIICANIFGSSYGSTSPLSINPTTGRPWLKEFPLVTIRDWANAHEVLCKHLNINRIHTLIGGSIGGFQAMEWAIAQPDRIQHLVLLVTSYYSNPWSIAINEAQRMAMEADASFFSGEPDGGKAGLAAARAIGMLSFRGYKAFVITQSEEDEHKTFGFRASSYQRYQGEKLSKRFSSHCFYSITRSQDSHHVGRGRDGAEKALGRIKAHTLVLGVSSDILFPPSEQEELARLIPQARLYIMDSAFGHDGFLIENEMIQNIILKFWQEA